MRNLTGLPVPPPHSREYQTLPGENDDSHSTLQNPFSSEAGESADSSSTQSNRSDSYLYPSQQTPAGGSAATSVRGGGSRHYTPSLLAGGAEFDRYPMNSNRRSQQDPGLGAGLGGAAAGGVAAGNAGPYASTPGKTYSDYSRSTFSDRSRSNSYSSATAVGNPFQNNADFSPFGGYPVSDFPLLIDEKEPDDWLHNPDPINDMKNDRACHRPDRRGFWAICAFATLVAGGLTVLIVLPVLAFTGVTAHNPPAHGSGGHNSTKGADSLSPYTYGMLKAVRTSLVDPDTPKEAQTIKSAFGDETWNLVFSDEFTTDGRTFYDGDDVFWTAVDIWYGATQDLEWYDPDAVTTENGKLVIQMDAFRNHNLNYRSGMLQSWNKFCFTQGRIEVGARLPGRGDVAGLWPGMWTLGNLGRPGYLASTDGLWPYAYNECDAGITPNQSSWDGINYLPGQRLNKCTCKGEDHPNPGNGRGVPEIDIIEATVASAPGSPNNGAVSQSLQVAPMDIWYMVDYNFVEVYNSSVTKLNSWTGGPFQQAISGVTYLNNNWYEVSEEKSFQAYAFEYMNDDNDGYIQWIVGDTPAYAMRRPALGPNGNVGDRQISKEPMSIVLNLGISQNWSYISWLDLVFPMRMEIDYVRVYQGSDSGSSVGCDPPNYPTFNYIAAHPAAYSNANYTHWADAGYQWPKNTLMDGCT